MMKKNFVAVLCAACISTMLLSACTPEKKTEPEVKKEQSEQQTEESKKAELEDGTYDADFQTDSGMFHVNDACDGKGTLTVKDGVMTLHISLTSKKILNLYPGLAEDAQKEGAEILQPTTDTITYDDGTTEEVYGFDVPVEKLGEEFDLALVGTKGKWYDHKVSVSNPVKKEQKIELPDGTYEMELTFEGGSGKAKILSPVVVNIQDGKAKATVEWTSKNYDYMLVDGEKYLPINAEGNSVFEIPVKEFDCPLHVVGDTVAMSEPHEIEYTLTFHSETKKELK